jgi:hypothetical protein
LNAAKLAAISAVRVEPVSLSATEAVNGIVATAAAIGIRVNRQSIAPQSQAAPFSTKMK